MLTDSQLRHDVEAELDWDTRIDDRRIGVSAKNGVVSLTGSVSSYFERQAAEEAAQAVEGVLAVANELIVTLPTDLNRSDAEIAEDATAALQFNATIPAGAIRITVRDGFVTLAGEVPSWHQKHTAQLAVSALRGIRGLNNRLIIRPSHDAEDVQMRITEALKRSARLDAERIRVRHAPDGTVTLEGEVSSLHDRNVAEVAAWQTPGVSRVVDHLTILPQ